MDRVDTPSNVMTTRTPAVIKKKSRSGRVSGMRWALVAPYHYKSKSRVNESNPFISEL